MILNLIIWSASGAVYLGKRVVDDKSQEAWNPCEGEGGSNDCREVWCPGVKRQGDTNECDRGTTCYVQVAHASHAACT